MNPIRKTAVAAALFGATVAGGAFGAMFLGGTANAQTDTSSSATADPATPPRDPSKGGHTANGITEELLTGDDATKATTAAEAAVPDGTVERVETDAEGAAYEAHVVKADGSHVTVKLNSDFSVSTIESGHK